MFDKLGTQWHVGMNGRTGLIYPVLFQLLDRMNLTPEEWDETFDEIRKMEAAALDQMRQQS